MRNPLKNSFFAQDVKGTKLLQIRNRDSQIFFLLWVIISCQRVETDARAPLRNSKMGCLGCYLGLLLVGVQPAKWVAG